MTKLRVGHSFLVALLGDSVLFFVMMIFLYTEKILRVDRKEKGNQNKEDATLILISFYKLSVKKCIGVKVCRLQQLKGS